MPTYTGHGDYSEDEWPYDHIPEGDTKEDWVAWIPAIKEVIETGWFDGYLKEIGAAARDRFMRLKAAEAANPTVDPMHSASSLGVYYDPTDDAYYRVRRTKDRARTYAEKLVVETAAVVDSAGKVTTPAKVRFSYEDAKGKVFDLVRRPELKIDLDKARDFGAAYGVCLRCGRGLKSNSPHIKEMIGPVCYRKIKDGEGADDGDS